MALDQNRLQPFSFNSIITTGKVKGNSREVLDMEEVMMLLLCCESTKTKLKMNEIHMRNIDLLHAIKRSRLSCWEAKVYQIWKMKGQLFDLDDLVR